MRSVSAHAVAVRAGGGYHHSGGGAQASKRLSVTPCSAEEVAEFESNPFAGEAVRLRRWDDVGKIEGLETPALEHFRPALRAGMRSATA
jgi:predicted HD phosphohydrolase